MTRTTRLGLNPTAQDDEEQPDHPTIDEVTTDRYGVPTAAYKLLARAHKNHVAMCDHRDTLFDDKHITRTLGYPEDLPDDPVGVYRDVQTGQLVQVGKNETKGWFVSRDYETHEETPYRPGEIIPAIESRRLVPASRSRVVDSDSDGGAKGASA